VTVSQTTGEAFIANTGADQVARIPEFTKLALNGVTITASIGSKGPLDIALDSSDNVVMRRQLNRVAFFFAKIDYGHAASFTKTESRLGCCCCSAV